MVARRLFYMASGLFILAFWSGVVGGSAAIGMTAPPPNIIKAQELPKTTATQPPITATPSSTCVTITGSTPRCSWPDTLSYYFGTFNSCNATLSGSGVVQLYLAADTSGPWTLHDEQAVNRSFPPGSGSVSGSFLVNNLPPEYRFYRFTLLMTLSNGQSLNSTTVAATLCNTAITPTPTRTGITIQCWLGASGALTNCFEPNTYTYKFGVYSACDTSMPGTVEARLEVSANPGGPWTTHAQQTYYQTFAPGANSVLGSFSPGPIPPQYSWYRVWMSVAYPGPFGNRYVYNQTVAEPICTPANTATPTATPTLTITPTPCPNSYNYTISTGTIISGTTLVPGSQCGSCIVNLALPFPVSFYGQTYTSANLSTQGNLQFTTTHLGANTCPLPEPLLGPAMMPHWDESLGTAYHFPCEAAMGSPCGIYTSLTGSAPNRIFNIEWRARFISTSQHTANFQIRLYEGSPYFEFIYGWVSYTGGHASIGVQDGDCRFTTYSCNTWYNIEPGRRISWGGLPPSSTPMSTASPSFTPTVVSSFTTTPTPTGTPAAPTPTICTITFEDVPSDHPFHTWIRCLACLGIVGGYDNGTFRPSNSVTRGQVAKFVSNAAGYDDEIPPDRQTFEDVPPDHPFWLWIERLALHSIIGGYDCGGPGEPCGPARRPYFRPHIEVTRGQLSKMASNAANFGGTPPPGSYTFTDVPPSHAFYLYIERLVARGAISGYECGSPPAGPCDALRRPWFVPGNNLTRGQTAKIIANAFFPGCAP